MTEPEKERLDYIADQSQTVLDLTGIDFEQAFLYLASILNQDELQVMQAILNGDTGSNYQTRGKVRVYIYVQFSVGYFVGYLVAGAVVAFITSIIVAMMGMGTAAGGPVGAIIGTVVGAVLGGAIQNLI